MLNDLERIGDHAENFYDIAKEMVKKELIAGHFARLAEGNCNMEVSPYYSSVVVGLERVADHLVNVGFRIVNPVGSQKEA